MRLLVVCGAAAVHGSSLSGQLRKLDFVSHGTVRSDDVFEWVSIESEYLEPENASKPEFAWADGNVAQPASRSHFLYRRESSCDVRLLPDADLPGGDTRCTALEGAGTLEACKKACCGDPGCSSFTFDATCGAQASRDCICGDPRWRKGTAACFLKDGAVVPQPRNSSYGIVSGVRKPAQNPPMGIRSAPPLGGLGCGSVELRADGSMTQWTTEGNSPGGSAKLTEQTGAVFGAKVGKSWAKAIRTHPPDGVPGVEAIEFSGAATSSRLRVVDAGLPDGVSLELHAVSPLVPFSAAESNIPAAAFSLLVTNGGDGAVDVSFMCSLPLAALQNTARQCSDARTRAPNATGCAAACESSGSCQAWTWRGAGSCSLCNTDALYGWEDGAWTGTPGARWSAGSHPGCLTLDRPGSGPSSGNYTVCGEGGAVSRGAAGSLNAVWDRFVAESLAPVERSVAAAHGALSVTKKVGAGESEVLTVVLGYNFPNRMYMGQNLGNYYNQRFKSSEEAALGFNLSHHLTLSAALSAPIAQSSLPEWLREVALGSLTHWRSAQWYRDGRWRQWEAYDCVDMDSVHNDGERHLPYMFLLPSTCAQKAIAWGKGAAPDGMIKEQFGSACLGGPDPTFDNAAGRVMGDVSTVYIFYVFELLFLANDTATASAAYDYAKGAAKWQIARAADTGLPQYLDTSFDILGFSVYMHTSYSAVLHITALQAMRALAEWRGDGDFAVECEVAYKFALESFEAILWREDLGYYLAYQGGKAAPGEVPLFTDTFYGLTMATSAGLPSLFNATRVRSHLDAVEARHGGSIGLACLSGRDSFNTYDADIWMQVQGSFAALRMRQGTPADGVLALVEPGFRLVTTTHNDAWNPVDIYRGATKGTYSGMPKLSSHYGTHMTLWHSLLAASGQTANMTGAGRLSFAPVVSGPFILPVMLPGVWGTLRKTIGADATPRIRLCVTLGRLRVGTVVVGNHSTGPVDLRGAPLSKEPECAELA